MYRTQKRQIYFAYRRALAPFKRNGISASVTESMFPFMRHLTLPGLNTLQNIRSYSAPHLHQYLLLHPADLHLGDPQYLRHLHLSHFPEVSEIY